jgi:hypothetical protein
MKSSAAQAPTFPTPRWFRFRSAPFVVPLAADVTHV